MENNKLLTAKELCEQITNIEVKSLIETLTFTGGKLIRGEQVCRLAQFETKMVGTKDYINSIIPSDNCLNKLKELGYKIDYNTKEVTLYERVYKKTPLGKWWFRNHDDTELVPYETRLITEIIISACCGE